MEDKVVNKFNWTSQDVEDLLKGTQNLVGSTKYSSFDNFGLLLNKPHFISNLLLQVIAEQEENQNLEGMQTTLNIIIGNLRWLLNQSLMYNCDSNNDTEASLCFSKNTHPSSEIKKRSCEQHLG